MHKCNNCEKGVDLAKAGDDGCLVLRQAGTVIVALCPKCTANVLLAKVVISRKSLTGEFSYDQFQPCLSGG